MNFYLRRTLLPPPLGKALAPVVAGRQLLAGLRGKVSLLDQPQNEASADCYALVRAANPWNRRAPLLRGQPLRLLGVTPHPNAATGPATPGTVLHADTTAGIWVACGAGEALRLDVVALDEGYFTGLQLMQLGVGVSEVLGSTPLLG